MADRGIYFVPQEVTSRPAIKFFSFATRQVTQIATMDKETHGGGGLAGSPDGRWILYTQQDQRISDIMLMENLR